MNNRPIRVAQVIGKAINGGTESFAMNYYKNIDRTKVQFDFLVESPSKIIDKKTIEELGGKIVIIPSYNNPIKYTKELTTIFKANNYDIVHSNMNTISFFTLKAAKKAGIKIRIAHSHSTSNSKEFFKSILKNSLRLFAKKYATHYFACGELAGKWLFGNKTFKKNKVTIIHNAININDFSFKQDKRVEIRQELNIYDKFVVGHVGRMCAQKNQKYLLDIFNEILKLKKESTLLFIGDGPLKNELEDYSKKLGIFEQIIFTGNITNVNDYYNAMDCFVLPSLYEGLAVVSIEAQACGLPCYFSNTITKEVLLSETSQSLSIDNEPKEWALQILSNSNSDNRINFLNSELEKYDICIQAKRLLEIYYTLVDKS